MMTEIIKKADSDLVHPIGDATEPIAKIKGVVGARKGEGVAGVQVDAKDDDRVGKRIQIGLPMLLLQTRPRCFIPSRKSTHISNRHTPKDDAITNDGYYIGHVISIMHLHLITVT